MLLWLKSVLSHLKLSEIERKLCGLYDITYKIYNSVSDSTAIGDDLGQKFCKDGHTNAIDQPNQNNERPLSEYYELTTDLEEVKLDAVINHTKLSNIISSNSKVIIETTQEINQLKEQLTNMQSERQTLIKEISKQSEIIKQLSSKVDNLQNTQVIHCAKHVVVPEVNPTMQNISPLPTMRITTDAKTTPMVYAISYAKKIQRRIPFR